MLDVPATCHQRLPMLEERTMYQVHQTMEPPCGSRYLHKSVGEAVLDVLRNTPFPLTLSQLVEDLKGGHLSTDARAVNASLLNMNGVEKLPDGSYQIESSPSIVNTDDLPF